MFSCQSKPTNLYLLTILILLNIFVCIKADLPPEIPKCRAGDLDCIKDSFNKVLHSYPDGNPQIGLSSLRKFTMYNVTVAQGDDNNAVALNLKFNIIDVYGIDKGNVTKLVGFERDYLNSKFEAHVDYPNVFLQGQYEVSGKILILPLQGKGNAKIEMIKPKLIFKVKLANAGVRNGKHYIAVKKIKSTVTIEGFKCHLDNLFNGNKELGESANKLINENSLEIWPDIKDGLTNTLSTMVHTLLSGVLKELSYDDFYLPE